MNLSCFSGWSIIRFSWWNPAKKVRDILLYEFTLYRQFVRKYAPLERWKEIWGSSVLQSLRIGKIRIKFRWLWIVLWSGKWKWSWYVWKGKVMSSNIGRDWNFLQSGCLTHVDLNYYRGNFLKISLHFREGWWDNSFFLIRVHPNFNYYTVLISNELGHHL